MVQRRGRNLLRAGVTLAWLMGLVGVAVAGSAVAGPGESSAPTAADKPGVVEATTFPVGVSRERITNQNALDAIADRIMHEEQERFTGAVDPILDVDGRSMMIRWYQITPEQRAAVQALADQYKVTITFEEAAHPLQALESATQRIQAATSELKTQGIQVNGITPHARESGKFEVDITRPGNEITLDAATEILEQTAGITITITERDLKSVPYTRQTDTSPFYGGGFMRPGCTSGFAVQQAGVSYLLTARHCEYATWTAYDGGSTYGTTQSPMVSSYGVMRIPASSAGYAFLGWYDSSSFRRVSAAQYVYSGDWVCTSGGNTGEHCSLQVWESVTDFTDSWGTFVAASARRQSGTDIAGGSGDSGGPVINYQPDGSVHAIGIIQGRKDPYFVMQCPSSTRIVPAECAWEVYFSQLTNVMGGFSGMSLKTA